MPARVDLATFNCSLARTLAVVGDGWSLLIVRNAWLGLRRFGEFQASLGIAKNILSERLDRLVADGVLARGGTARRPTYELTARGHDLLPALVALMQWGDKWISAVPPMLLVGPDDAAVRPVQLWAGERSVESRSLRIKAGPGANAQTRAFLDELHAAVAERDDQA